MSFSGKTAIVTGAGGGMGSEITKQLASLGAWVSAWDVNEGVKEVADRINQSLAKDLVKPVQIDLSDTPLIISKVNEIADEHGKIDFLVNNAGIMQTIPWLDIDESAWDRMMDINLKSVFFLIQSVGRHMIAQKSGAMVNISSIAGRSGRPLAAHYAASKTGVLSLTKSAALAFGEYGIRVNAICPGVVLTPMMEQINRDRAKMFGIENESNVGVNEFLKNVPLQQAGDPGNIADAVIFLCSRQSSYIHGQAINVCGGYEMN